MKTIVIAGNILVDIVKTIEQYPKPTMLARIQKEEKAVGGCVCNTGIDLKTLDQDLCVQALGVIGNDPHGKYVIDKMQQYGVDTSFIRISNHSATGYTDVMTDLKGERTFFNYRGANQELNELDFAFLTKEKVSLIHIGYLLLLDQLDEVDEKYGTKMARLLSTLQRKGIQTSIDMVSEDSKRFAQVVKPALKYCDYIIINEFEAGKIFSIPPRNADGSIHMENIRLILHACKKAGVKRKAIIHCPEFGALIDEKEEITIVPSFHLPPQFVRGSVGAGDAFCAGALLGIIKQYNNEKILRLATCSATHNLQVMDSISGAKNEAETWQIETTLERRKSL